jgi:hypothetical protein
MQPPAHPQQNYHPQFTHNPQQSMPHVAPPDPYMPYQQSHSNRPSQSSFFGGDDAWGQEGMGLPEMNDFPPHSYGGTYPPDGEGEGEGEDEGTHRGGQPVGNTHNEDNPNYTPQGPGIFDPAYYLPQPPQQTQPNPPQLLNMPAVPAEPQRVSDFSIAAGAVHRLPTSGVSVDEINRHLAAPTYRVRDLT